MYYQEAHVCSLSLLIVNWKSLSGLKSKIYLNGLLDNLENLIIWTTGGISSHFLSFGLTEHVVESMFISSLLFLKESLKMRSIFMSLDNV